MVFYFFYIAGCYLLMLAVMTYSTGLFLTICFGLGTGYFLLQKLEPSYLSSECVMKACH
jgi:Ctr copper transporter family.